MLDIDDDVRTPLDERDAELQEAQLVFGSTEEWVREWLLPTYVRNITPNAQIKTWCPSWWEHAEAIQRLEALWRAWEYLRLDSPLGMSIWWKDHADHHLPILLDTAGPFRVCSIAKGHNEAGIEPLVAVPAPPELFPNERATSAEAY